MSEITKEQYEALFLEMNPGYFERDYVRAIPENEPAWYGKLGYKIIVSWNGKGFA
jgi:hypothetical protein